MEEVVKHNKKDDVWVVLGLLVPASWRRVGNPIFYWRGQYNRVRHAPPSSGDRKVRCRCDSRDMQTESIEPAIGSEEQKKSPNILNNLLCSTQLGSGNSAMYVMVTKAIEPSVTGSGFYRSHHYCLRNLLSQLLAVRKRKSPHIL